MMLYELDDAGVDYFVVELQNERMQHAMVCDEGECGN